MQYGSVAVERVPVAICTSHLWARGLVELRGSTQLIDVLNQNAAAALSLLNGEILPIGATQWPEARPRVILNKAEILFAHPVGDAAERVIPPIDTAIQRYPVTIGLHLGGYHVQGTLHLPDRVAWEQYLTALRDRFLALTRVTITRAVDGTTVGAAASAAVNRERLSVLYEQ
jgi:hypothetical protein